MIENETRVNAMDSANATLPSLYLDLLKRTLTRTLFAPGHETGAEPPLVSRWLQWSVRRVFVPAYMGAVRHVPAIHRAVGPIQRSLRKMIAVHPLERLQGRDWPADAETMIGHTRLDNLQASGANTGPDS